MKTRSCGSNLEKLNKAFCLSVSGTKTRVLPFDQFSPTPEISSACLYEKALRHAGEVSGVGASTLVLKVLTKLKATTIIKLKVE